jgi:hypothetical protein
MVHVARSAHQDVSAAVFFGEEAKQRLPIKACHAVDGSEDRLTQRMVGPQSLAEKIVNQLVGCVLHHVYLLEDNPPFLLDIVKIENRIKQNVAQKIQGDRQFMAGNLGIVATIFLTGKSVKDSAD